MSPIYVPGKVTLAKDYIPVDPEFANVSLLLHGDGTNGSTTIVDSSPSPKTVTAVGGAQISTAQSKFGGSSLKFDGNGDYLTIPDDSSFDFGFNDFTIEGWIYTQKANEYCVCSDSGIGGFMLVAYSNQFRFRRYGVADVVVASFPPATNTWIHVAACRSGTSTRLFFNGVQTGATATDTADYTIAANTLVGVDTPLFAPYYFQGYIDDFRITKGVARYTSNFTPPTAPFPDIESR